MMKNKRGSAMVEATLIIPVIVITIMSIIHIIVSLYYRVEINCALHENYLQLGNGESVVGDFIRKIDVLKGLI